MAGLVGVHVKTVGELIRILERYDETQELRVMSNSNATLCAISVVVHPTKGKIILFPETRWPSKNINKRKNNDE